MEKKVLTIFSIFLGSVFLYVVFYIFPAQAQVRFLRSTSESSSVSKLNQKISQKKREIEDLKLLVKDYESEIEKNKDEKINLESQISELGNQIAKKELDLRRVNLEMEKINLEIDRIKAKIEEKEKDIELQQKRLSFFIREIHLNDQKNYLNILLLNNNFSDFFNTAYFLENLEVRVADSFNELKNARDLYEADNISLVSKFDDLRGLEFSQKREKFLLESQVEAKQTLISQTQDDEERFQELLSQIRSEQASINRDILSIKKNIESILAQRAANYKWDPNNIKLLWPIANTGITTFFQDPSYPFRHIVGQHSGIDMRTLINGRPSVGLQVRSVGPGVVVKVIRNGRFVGNAIYLAHSNDFMSIYLHLSRVDVKVDDIVKPGQLIGLSGGMPGTPGAGLSSGPHLHFEVRLNGIPVDPLQYLD